MVAWALLALAVGIEVDLDAQGRSTLARHHKHHHGGAHRAEHQEEHRAEHREHRAPHIPQLEDLDSHASEKAWASKYYKLQEKAEDLGSLLSESLRVGHAYRSAKDPHGDHARTLYSKYYDLRDEYRAKRRDVKRRATDLLSDIGRPESRVEAAVRGRVGSLLEQLAPRKSAALGEALRHRARSSLVQDSRVSKKGAPDEGDEQDEAAGDEPGEDAEKPAEEEAAGDEASGDVAGDDEAADESEGEKAKKEEIKAEEDAEATETAEGQAKAEEAEGKPAVILDRADPEGDADTISLTAGAEEMNEYRPEISAKQPTHHERLREALSEYKTPRCEARSDCGGCENDNGNEKFHCRKPDDNTCSGWMTGAEPRKCDEDKGYFSCDGPVVDRSAKPVAEVELTPDGQRMQITIQGWGFTVNENPLEDTCLVGTLIPRKRLVEDMAIPGHKLESACSKKALEKNLELQIARCLMDEVTEEDAPRDNRCDMAHLSQPMIKAARAGGKKGTNSVHFHLYPPNVLQPYEFDVHYVMCLVRGPTLEDAETGFAFVAGGTEDPICVRKTQEGGEDKLIPCANDNAKVPPAQGGASVAALLAMLFLIERS